MSGGGGTKLFVYGVHNSCPKTVLEDEFGRSGKVDDVHITEKGYAFVTMADEQEAKAAIDDLNGKTIDGQEIKVSFSGEFLELGVKNPLFLCRSRLPTVAARPVLAAEVSAAAAAVATGAMAAAVEADTEAADTGNNRVQHTYIPPINVSFLSYPFLFIAFVL